MKHIIHTANSRGHVQQGWLDTHHTFSFADYYDPERIHFGNLRVLNDDTIAGGNGFGMHPHRDMEIITIPLSGMLTHKDTMGNMGMITAGEVQVMSAGTGVTHSEFNYSPLPVSLFQIWIFPKQWNVTPRYEQKRFDTEQRKGAWQLLVSPDGREESTWVHQDAFLSIVDLSGGGEILYRFHKKGNGVYFILVEGEISIQGHQLQKRDAIGIWETDALLDIQAAKQSTLLAIEVPMETTAL